MTRREVLRCMAVTAAIGAAEAVFPGIVFAVAPDPTLLPPAVEWKKTPCRFCGVGCGLLVGIGQGRAVAVKGDPASPVNKGLCCVKGYHAVMALYGKDPLTQALVRKDGTLVPVPMKDALDLVAAKMAETIKDHGKDAVAMYGSGQWTISDGYVAAKFMKAGIGTNNLEANSRLCMASAVSGFLTSFGLDEPMGCFEDIDHADTFVIWGNNMAEMHPVLFSRMLDRRRQNPQVKIIDVATRWTRTSMAADRSMLFVPQTDLACLNVRGLGCGEPPRVSTVHLEPLGQVSVPLHQAEVMEHRCDVKKLWIGLDPKALTVKHPEQICSPGVVVQQWRLGVLDKGGCLMCHLRVGDGDTGDVRTHDLVLTRPFGRGGPHASHTQTFTPLLPFTTAFTIAQPSSPMSRLPRCFAAAPVAGCAAPANRPGCCK